MEHFWPFRIPEMVEDLYRTGCVHGAFVASLAWIALLTLIAAAVIAVRFGRQRELLVGLAGLLIGVLLWWGSRMPAPRLPEPPAPRPTPKPPAPWRPWKRGQTAIDARPLSMRSFVRARPAARSVHELGA